MITEQANWIFNFVLRLAVIVFLSTLAVGLAIGVDPLVALMRSSVAFFSFLVLGWSASMLWNISPADKVEVTTQSEEDNTGDQHPSPEAHSQPVEE